MAHKKMYATAPMRYGTRMLKAGDPVTMSGPEATLHHALGHVTAKKPPKPVPEPVEPVALIDELSDLREEYRAKFDKRPGYGWDVETLKAKIAEGPTD